MSGGDAVYRAGSNPAFLLALESSSVSCSTLLLRAATLQLALELSVAASALEQPLPFH